MMEIDLPDDVIQLVVAHVRARLRRGRAALRIQTNFRMYRIKTLMVRFRMLRHLLQFRQFNPSATVFISRAKL